MSPLAYESMDSAGEQTAGRRRRVPFQGEASLLSAGRVCQTRLIDLSLDGALFVLPFRCRMTVGMPVEVEIASSDGAVVFAGRVVSCRSSRVRVRCHTIGAAHAERLRGMVERHLGDESLADRALERLS